MPAIQAHHARVDMAAKPSTHGAMNTSTPITTAAHSAKRFDGLDRFQRPARNSNAPPMYAVHANGACDVAPKTNGVMKSSTPTTTFAQSCQRLHVSDMALFSRGVRPVQLTVSSRRAPAAPPTVPTIALTVDLRPVGSCRMFYGCVTHNSATLCHFPRPAGTYVTRAS